jgi:hypothetical protein
MATASYRPDDHTEGDDMTQAFQERQVANYLSPEAWEGARS